MAFSLDAGVGDTTTSLNDGNPFWLESAEGLSGANIVRHEQRSPLQLGATDLGYRLSARVMTLNLLFYATTDAALDTHRQTLMDVFKPLTDTSIFLTATRDDGTVRRLTCFAVGDVAIALVPEHRPGHLHRATVRLRAANPLWVDQGVNVSALPTNFATSWWLAGGTIPAANVMENRENPGNGVLWNYAGTITGAWSIAFRSEAVAPDFTNPRTVFHAGTSSLRDPVSKDARLGYNNSTFELSWGPDADEVAVGLAGGGTQNYMAVHTAADLLTLYYAGTVKHTNEYTRDYDISGPQRRWRSDRAGSANSYWPAALPKVAVYDIALSEAQRVALDVTMSGSVTSTHLITAVNSGDVPSYPYITIRGPMVNPVLVNLATNGTLDLTGLTLGSADTYRIDLRDGNKTAFDQNENNLLSSITNPMSLARWYLAPDPIATGGTNQIQVRYGSVSSNTAVSIEHYDQYMSF